MMAGYALGLCGRPSLRDHFSEDSSSWMVLPPYPQYPGSSAGTGISAMAGSLVGVSSVGHGMADYALASSLQQRRSPLSSAAYTHSWSVRHSGIHPQSATSVWDFALASLMLSLQGFGLI